MGLNELQKCNGSGVLGPIIGLANMNAGVFSACKCAAEIGFGLIIGTGVAMDRVVVTVGVTFKLSGLGLGLDDDVLDKDLFCDRFSAVMVSPEVDADPAE